jgi:hypothetical protein
MIYVYVYKYFYATVFIAILLFMFIKWTRIMHYNLGSETGKLMLRSLLFYGKTDFKNSASKRKNKFYKFSNYINYFFYFMLVIYILVAFLVNKSAF